MVIDGIVLADVVVVATGAVVTVVAAVVVEQSSCRPMLPLVCRSGT